MKTTLCVLTALCGYLYAQPKQFEAATVRPNNTLNCQGQWGFTQAHGRLTAENVSLKRLVSRAYGLTDDRVSGPAWIESECYDVVARAQGDPPDVQLMSMLQALLQERFHLALHRESSDKAIFALLVDKNGPKLHEYKPGDMIPVPSSPGAGRSFFMLSGGMAALAERISSIVGRPVADKTGLRGNYRIAVSYAPSMTATAPDVADPGTDIFSAVREQLGLRLEAQRGTIEILKVDAADRIPIEN